MILGDDVQLGYCTNIHAAETADDLCALIGGVVGAVKAIAAPEQAFGVGLRVSARAAAELEAPEAFERLRSAMAAADIYAFTINGFVHGDFHGTPIKADVYRPDWRAHARVAYTLALVSLLAKLAPSVPGLRPSISTAPLGFATDVSASDLPQVRAHLIDVACELWRVAERGGPTLVLALEPEPCCTLETVAQTVAFFAEHLHGREAVAAFARATGVDRQRAELALRTHLGVCLDACHAAVEFEDPCEAIDALLDAGIAIAKIQVSAGLELVPNDDALAALARFADPIYLHQVVRATPSGLVRHVDLADAFAAPRARELAERWRVHFHVPVYCAALAPLHTTQAFTAALLTHARRRGACQQFEVETYTWDVLPPEHRMGRVEQAIARELAWTRAQLR